jgi:hypothetical protein
MAMTRKWKTRCREMHRRAQKAEGRLEACLFWAEAVQKWARQNGDQYVANVAGEMIKEMQRYKKPDVDPSHNI